MIFRLILLFLDVTPVVVHVLRQLSPSISFNHNALRTLLLITPRTKMVPTLVRVRVRSSDTTCALCRVTSTARKFFEGLPKRLPDICARYCIQSHRSSNHQNASTKPINLPISPLGEYT